MDSIPINIRNMLIFFSLAVISRCSVWNDISAERRGCDFENSGIIQQCAAYFYLDQMSRKETGRDIDNSNCLTAIYFHEKCKKRLRENSIP